MNMNCPDRAKRMSENRPSARKTVRRSTRHVISVAAIAIAGGASCGNADRANAPLAQPGPPTSETAQSAPGRSVEDAAGLTPTVSADTANNALPAVLTKAPASWIGVVQMPFRSGAAFVFDWADASDHRSIELNGDRTKWIVVDVTDSVATTLATFPNEKLGDDTLVMRRFADRLEIDLPDASSQSLSITSDPSRTAVGATFKLGAVPIAQFDIGELDPRTDDHAISIDPNSETNGETTQLTIPTAAKEIDAQTERIDVPREPITLGPNDYSVFRIAPGNALADAIVFAPKGVPAQSAPLVSALPGFLATWSSISWLGPQLASHGIVVAIGVPKDLAASPQFRSVAMKTLTENALVEPRLTSIIDPQNVHVAGHSMGGGAALHRAAIDDSVTSVIALSPWVDAPPTVATGTPTLIISCENDTVAPFDENVQPLIAAYEGAPTFQWIEIANGDHDCTTNRTVNNETRRFLAESITRWVSPQVTTEGPQRVSCDTIVSAKHVARVIPPC